MGVKASEIPMELIERTNHFTLHNQDILVRFESKLIAKGYKFHIFPHTDVVSKEVRQFIRLTSLPYVFGGTDINIDDVWGNCADCTLMSSRLMRDRYFVPIGNLKPVYFIVGDAPGQTGGYGGQLYQEGEVGRMWVNPFSPTCVLLREALFLLGIHHLSWYTNFLRRSVGENKPSDDAERLACSKHIERELVLLQPKYVILLGNHAFTSWVDKGVKVFKVKHPAFARRLNWTPDQYADSIYSEIKMSYPEFERIHR